MEDLLPTLLFRFMGGSNHKYATEILELLHKLQREWPEELQETLADIIQLNPMSGQASIIMRVSCAWDNGEQSYIPKWEFLNTDRNPLAGKGARARGLMRFLYCLCRSPR